MPACEEDEHGTRSDGAPQVPLVLTERLLARLQLPGAVLSWVETGLQNAMVAIDKMSTLDWETT